MRVIEAESWERRILFVVRGLRGKLRYYRIAMSRKKGTAQMEGIDKNDAEEDLRDSDES